MNHEHNEREGQVYSDKIAELITVSHLEDVLDLESADLEREIIDIKQRIDDSYDDLEKKKQQLLNAVRAGSSHKEIEVLVAELINKYQHLSDLKIQFTERLTVKAVKPNQK